MNLSTKTHLTRTREKLHETRHATVNAATSGMLHVLQHRTTGAVISARTGYFTFNLSESYGVSENTPPLFGAEAVPVAEAREAILTKIEEAIAEVEGKLAVG